MKWQSQVSSDCPSDKEWVIFNQANGAELIAIVSLANYLKNSSFCYIQRKETLEFNDSINPSSIIDRTIRATRIESSLHLTPIPDYLPLAVYEIPATVLVMMRATDWLKIFVEPNVKRVSSSNC
jgi:hypothetical protein